jgi:hypothetical protein
MKRYYEAVGLGARGGFCPDFNQWIQDNPTPCGATCSDQCAAACEVRA